MNEYELCFYENGMPCGDIALIPANSTNDAVDKFLKERNLNVRTKKVSGKDIDTNCSHILIWEKGTQRLMVKDIVYLVEDVTINEQAENGRKE